MNVQNIFVPNKIFFLGIITVILMNNSCTKLEENLNSELNEQQAQAYLSTHTDFDVLLETVYRDFDNTFCDYHNVFALQEVTTDEAIVPSRPSGWDDDGIWRALYTHTWDADHIKIVNTYTALNKGAFDATNILSFDPNPQVAAKARFLRAYFMYTLLDLYGKFPFRDPGTELSLLPKVYEGQDAINFIISEVEAVLNELPADAPDYEANKNAAYGLLARMYLNKGVYGNQSSPEFDQADMDKVITYANLVSGKSLNFYWNNFQPNNGEISTEIIFSDQSLGGTRNNGQQWIMYGTMLAEATLPQGGGWNGWATTPDFYNSFTDGDIRKSYDDSVVTKKGGFNMGFLVGQQFEPGGTDPIQDVIITIDITTMTGESNYSGVRVMKYAPDYDNASSQNDDWILIGYSDVLLMKAEALFRNGRADEALDIVNNLRSNRCASPGSLSPLTSLTESDLLAERGRELYWQDCRRTDLIRFGKFLDARLLKPLSDPKYLLFPLPRAAVLANENLIQNPGY